MVGIAVPAHADHSDFLPDVPEDSLAAVVPTVAAPLSHLDFLFGDASGGPSKLDTLAAVPAGFVDPPKQQILGVDDAKVERQLGDGHQEAEVGQESTGNPDPAAGEMHDGDQSASAFESLGEGHRIHEVPGPQEESSAATHPIGAAPPYQDSHGIGTLVDNAEGSSPMDGADEVHGVASPGESSLPGAASLDPAAEEVQVEDVLKALRAASANLQQNPLPQRAGLSAGSTASAALGGRRPRRPGHPALDPWSERIPMLTEAGFHIDFSGLKVLRHAFLLTGAMISKLFGIGLMGYLAFQSVQANLTRTPEPQEPQMEEPMLLRGLPPQLVRQPQERPLSKETAS